MMQMIEIDGWMDTATDSNARRRKKVQGSNTKYAFTTHNKQTFM
jgi:hypothetical protein